MSEMDDLSDDLVVICTKSLLSGYEGDVEPLSQLPRSDEFNELIAQIEESSIPELASDAENCRFVYKSDATVKETQEHVVPATTKKSTSWAVTIWTEWSKGRQKHFRNNPMELPPPSDGVQEARA